ncbi:unnamed protein product [Dibothriocephalus latus]|uniref:Coatomer gamma subunit appendage Ig-like subdomain domain-containing protein n=1 Tax=Dibothriocephalus latus TaxID=60516 RepID=A0A3P7NR68_DIBLA|nr:unnamed protein product [Dibothriocephalus latus]
MDRYAEQLAAIPEIKSLGPLFKSSAEVELTDPGAEYVVTCVKHTFRNHMVLQYECTNTMEDQLLENVYVELESEDEDYEVLQTIPCPNLEYNKPGSVYVIVELPETVSSLCNSFTNTLKFIVKDASAGPSDPGLSDEYSVSRWFDVKMKTKKFHLAGELETPSSHARLPTIAAVTATQDTGGKQKQPP